MNDITSGEVPKNFAHEITIFINIKSTNAGHFRDAKTILERIKIGKSKSIIERVRSETNKDKRNILKQSLPAICFSGTFNKRTDNGLINHSGLICLDFDDFETNKELTKRLTELKEDQYTYSIFISPSGNGLKVLVKIPADREKHRLYFKALEEYYNDKHFDVSCKNESRVCYESYDPDLFINDNSKLFDILPEEKHKEYGKDRVTIPVKSDNTIITKLITWFNKNYSMTDGERNANLFKLAMALNDFGVDKMTASSVLYGFTTTGLNKSEIENVLNSAYRNIQNHKTKFFEDHDTKNEIRKKVRSGSTIKEIKASFPIDAGDIDLVISEIKEEPSISEFWEYDKNGNLKFLPNLFTKYLSQNGMVKYYPHGSNNFLLVSLKNNRISNTTPSRIKDFILSEVKEQVKPFNYIASKTSLFKEDYLGIMETAELKTNDDNQDTAYLYYRNHAVKVTKKGYDKIDYLDLKYAIWDEYVIDRDFVDNDPDESEFKKFIELVAKKDVARFNSICTVIGYLLHSYKNAANNRAIIFNDEQISEIPNGGSGKGIIAQALKHMKRVVQIDGKQFEFNKSFPYQTVSADTQILIFDDVKRSFAFENLFSLVTEGITLEKKNKDAIKLPVDNSPKILITTNYAVNGEGGSFERRKFDVELGDYFNANHTPYIEFGHMLFDDWSDDDWSKFDNFMIHCMIAYLNNGLIACQPKNIQLRKLINSTSNAFYEFIEDAEIPIDDHFIKSTYFNEFIVDNPDQKKYLPPRRFYFWMDKWAKFKGYEIDNTKKLDRIRYTIYKQKNETIQEVKSSN